MKTNYWFCLCVFIYVLLSCNKLQKEADLIFKEVANLVEQYPDSALVLLDSIRNPYELDPEQYAEYHLLSIPRAGLPPHLHTTTMGGRQV